MPKFADGEIPDPEPLTTEQARGLAENAEDLERDSAYGDNLTLDDAVAAPADNAGAQLPIHYVDKAMFDAEPSNVDQGPKVYMLSGTPDPLGAVAAMSMMYEGRTIRKIGREVTDEERRHYFDQCAKTALKTPLEAIDLHFMVEDVTRATADQARTQRTAVFAMESLRFAVKPDLKDSVRPGPNVLTREQREIHDRAVEQLEQQYRALIAAGVPQEDARGLLPMNTLTRFHWKTNLRNLESEIGKRLCTQAQFEWRILHARLREAMGTYKGVITGHGTSDGGWPMAEYNSWQWEYIANSNMFKPICFQKGACMFQADVDRGCTIRDRVEAGKFDEIDVLEWAGDPQAAWVR